MRIILSKHAKERIKFRGIPERRVVQTICEPEEALSSFRSRQVFRRVYGAKILEVVAKIEGRDIIVVTAYYLGEKYEGKIRSKN